MNRARGHLWFAGLLMAMAPAPAALAARDIPTIPSDLPHTPKLPAMPVERVWKAMCSNCHGETGRGDGNMAASLKRGPPDFSSWDWQRTRNDGQIRQAILEGVKMPGKPPVMPAFARVLDLRTVDQLVRLIRDMD